MPGTSPGNGMPVRSAKTKFVDVMVKLLLAQSDADLGRADVGGFGDDVFHRQHAEGLVVVQRPARVN